MGNLTKNAKIKQREKKTLKLKLVITGKTVEEKKLRLKLELKT
jgi:hypothetical protein